MNYERIPAFVPGEKGLVHAVIETPQGIRQKYAFEPRYRIMTLRATLAEGLAWPYDYGFIPQTRGEDGDPLDVLVLGDVPAMQGCLMRVRVIGAVLLKKNGIENDRLVACPAPSPGTAQRADAYREMSDLPEAMLRGIERFLVEYSAEQGHTIELLGTCSKRKATAHVRSAHARFAKKS